MGCFTEDGIPVSRRRSVKRLFLYLENRKARLSQPTRGKQAGILSEGSVPTGATPAFCKKMIMEET